MLWNCVNKKRPNSNPSLSLLLGAAEIDFEDDPDLLTAPEAEAWSVTVDKKTLKKMSAKDIKRQDHIWGKSLGLW